MDLLRQIEAVLFTADERILDRIELADRADPSIYPVLSISTPQHAAAHAGAVWPCAARSWAWECRLLRFLLANVYSDVRYTTYNV